MLIQCNDLSLVHSCVQSVDFDFENELKYRAEGNSALVLSLKKRRQVIRLLKVSEKENCDQNIRQLFCHVFFNDRVLSQLISPQFLHKSPELVKLNAQQMVCIQSTIGDKRPEFRLDKSIAKDESYALLLPDFCFVQHFDQILVKTKNEGICVEIKPKQGFLVNENLLNGDLKIKSRVSRYCLSQFLKLEKKKITEVSDYCPLDLFSGCPTRMKRAIYNLLQNPQNNFRVFDTKLNEEVYGEKLRVKNSLKSFEKFLNTFFGEKSENRGKSESKTDLFIDLLIKSLLFEFKESERHTDSEEHIEHIEHIEHGEFGQDDVSGHEFCQMHRNFDHNNNEDLRADDKCKHFLPKSCVLSEILFLQKYDSIDSEIASKMFEFLQKENDFSLLDYFLKNSKYLLMNTKAVKAVTKRDLYLTKIWQFLISLTLKDCSVMVSVQTTDQSDVTLTSRDHNNNNNNNRDHCFLIEVKGRVFVVSIAITDLDPKQPKKIIKTFQNDKRIVKAFNSYQKQ